MDITIGYEETLYGKAQCLAQTLNLPLDNQAPNRLMVTEHGLILSVPPFKDLQPCFTATLWQKRKAEGKRQGLVKACKPRAGLKILDVTAGWGRDAAILASFSAEVLMLERHPVIFALLADALNRQDLDSKQSMRLSLKHINALDYFKTLAIIDYPDVIYIDPMHPERNKSALVKKDLQVLQDLIGPDEDAKAVICAAKKVAKERVVVKWPQSLPPLLTPSFSIPGKTVRFDVYYTPLFHSAVLSNK